MVTLEFIFILCSRTAGLSSCHESPIACGCLCCIIIILMYGVDPGSICVENGIGSFTHY